MACANQQRADHAKTIHKTGANYEQIRTALDHFLRPADFVAMF